MTDYTELLELLRYCSSRSGCIGCKLSEAYDCTADLTRDAAAAIEDMAKHITEMHERVTVLQIDRGQLEAEVKRLKECNDELREKQTFIDHWGTRWGTSAKDVPDSAYKHGYADGKYEALTLEECIDRLHELGWLQEHDRILSQPHWVRCDEALPEIGQRVIVYDGWMQFMTRKDDQLFNGKMYWENEEGNWERVDYEAYWMPIEPPKEDA